MLQFNFFSNACLTSCVDCVIMLDYRIKMEFWFSQSVQQNRILVFFIGVQLFFQTDVVACGCNNVSNHIMQHSFYHKLLD